MSEAAFWSWIRSSLRRSSMCWKPIGECKKLGRRKYTGENKRRKWEYLCAFCGEYFMSEEIEVDHKIEAGSLKCSDDLKGFVERLFCEVDGLQLLCKECHSKKTNKKK